VGNDSIAPITTDKPIKLFDGGGLYYCTQEVKITRCMCWHTKMYEEENRRSGSLEMPNETITPPYVVLRVRFFASPAFLLTFVLPTLVVLIFSASVIFPLPSR